MLKIVQSPDTVLSRPAKPIINIDKAIHHLIRDMKETLINAKDPQGVGLAAPQIGKSIQLFIIRQTPRSPILVFINPKIEQFFDKPEINEDPKEQKNLSAGLLRAKTSTTERGQDVQLEGCLSLSNIWGVVKRHPGIILSYLDDTGQKHRKKFNGFIATIIQHEYDHLRGTLFPKKVLEQKNQLYKSIKNAKGETEFEEIKL
ncbi:peptide deformylase [Patescibacteria group bacterium]|nr:peptide deformylase [Patescibacteria group bacterium]MBU4099673.1 peptide deformylase [Patescibacteria group bacterium]